MAVQHHSCQSVTIGQMRGEVPHVEAVALGDVTGQTVVWVARDLSETVAGFGEY